jgi:hypothetical protein
MHKTIQDAKLNICRQRRMADNFEMIRRQFTNQARDLPRSTSAVLGARISRWIRCNRRAARRQRFSGAYDAGFDRSRLLALALTISRSYKMCALGTFESGGTPCRPRFVHASSIDGLTHAPYGIVRITGYPSSVEFEHVMARRIVVDPE